MYWYFSVASSHAINGVSNLNALSTGQNFGVAQNGLTVVYGDNGVGKSGYGRLFNNAFYSRGDSFLMGNVYGPNKLLPPSAMFEFVDEGKASLKLKFPEHKSHPAFKQFSAFDSKSVNVHIDTQNELHVQPVELDFFESLINLTKLVMGNLELKQGKINEANVFCNLFTEDSEIKQAVLNLSAKTEYSKVEGVANLSDEEEKRMDELEKEKNSLNLVDLDKNKKILINIKNRATTLKNKISELTGVLSKEKADLIFKGIERYEVLKTEVERNGVENFSDPRFTGIGSEEWQQFIKNGSELAKLGTEKNLCIYTREILVHIVDKI